MKLETPEEYSQHYYYLCRQMWTLGNWKYKIYPIWKSNKRQRDTETDTLLHLLPAYFIFLDIFFALVNVRALGHRESKTQMRNSFHCQWPEDNKATWKHNKGKIFSYKRKKLDMKNDDYYLITWSSA